MFESNPRVNRAFVEMVELFDLGDDVVFDGLGEGHAVRDENQFHKAIMLPGLDKIQ